MATNAKGMFNFESLMGDFYGYTPDDDEGKLQKRGFQGDFIQSALDSQLAMAQAAQAQAFELDASKQMMDLDLRNQTQARKDQFDYGMAEMGAKFDFDSRFAVDEAGREANRMAQAGDIQQNQTKLEGSEQRQIIGEQGGVDVKKIQEGGKVDISKIGAGGVEERANIAAQTEGNIQQLDKQKEVDIAKIEAGGKVELDKIGAQSSADVRKIGSQGEVDLTKIGATGTEERKTIGTQGDVDLSKIGKTAEEGRETLREQNRLEAKTRANQSQYSRQLAAR